MKLFEKRGLLKAYEYVKEGGQALHVYDGMHGQFPDAPTCFKRSKKWGHLLDMDKKRLIKTARRLGVNKIVVARKGTYRQHVDLCGRPLERAINECN